MVTMHKFFTTKVHHPQLSESNNILVAKVYDPLYFDDSEGLLNPFLWMDKYYTHEARAYEAFSDLQGKRVPTFHGSYSLSLLVEGFAERTVRLILLDFVPGYSMAQVKPEGFTHSRVANR